MSLRFAGAVLVALFPIAGWSQSTLNFPVPADTASGALVGYAIVNPGRAAATVNFAVYEENGNQTGSASISVPAGGQVARLFSELFGNSNANGWVQATSTASGLQGITMGGDFVNNVDGIASADASADQVFPLTADTTTIIVANPTPAPANIAMRFFSSAGTEAAPGLDLTLAGHGMSIQPLSDRPSREQYANVAYVRITAAGEFAATAMVAQYLIAKPEFALYNGINAAKAGSTLNFAHVVSGELGAVSYRTAVALTNLSSAVENVTIKFTPDSGAAPASVQIAMSPGAGIHEVIAFPGAGFKNGWLQVQSSGPIAGVMSVANADDRNAGIAIVQAQGNGSTTMFFPHIANSAPWSTGIAFANPTQNPATIEVFAVGANGTSIGSAATFTLEPGAKTAKLLNELIPQARDVNGGFVFVRTNLIPILGLELFTLRSGGPMANVPAGPSASGVTFTPPAQ